ncbi:MAG TPA: hypothetical protein VFA89_24065 [Terriglobales bacterium]|nr:hypothetical protein [Terriglobales bacterium]
MASTEAMRETGGSLMFVGLAVWVVDLLVVFFLPAAVKVGREPQFLGVIVALGILGLLLMGFGYSARSESSEE